MNPSFPGSALQTDHSPVEDEQMMQASMSSGSEIASTGHAAPHSILKQLVELHPDLRDRLFHQLLTHLETDQIQALVELGLQELGDRRRRTALSTPQTHLLLKKDYSYRERGLQEPTQYYVYLRRRKPKLDRYIGALFYIPQGCTLSYSQDDNGRILFHSPRCFQLRDSRNPAVIKIVRLIALEPPSSEYTFDKQQNDTPNIILHLEYLEPATHQLLSHEEYPFPLCMYEKGTLDRYRWEVSPVLDQTEV